MYRARTLCILAGSGLLGSTALAGDPFFIGLGDLDGGAFNSLGSAISRDGSIVLGVSRAADGFETVRWVDQGVPSSLGFLGYPYGVSDDGFVVVGNYDKATNVPNEAYHWEDPDAGGVGVRTLGFLPDHNRSEARGVSADGLVVVGYSLDNQTGMSARAFRWTDPDAGGLGMVDLGTLAGSGTSAMDVSADGTVIVGGSFLPDPLLWHAYRWVLTDPETGEGVMTDLGSGYSSEGTRAAAVSADGSIVVGAFEAGVNDEETFRWTETGGMEFLGRPAGRQAAVPEDVSDDGRVIVGKSERQPFIWTEDIGMRLLDDYLVNDLGLDLTGWNLTNSEPVRVSGNGRLVVGSGRNPDGKWEAWLAYLGGSCAADLNDDGVVNTQDFIAYLNDWANGEPVADWNGDGTINTQDFIAYLNDWAAGC